MIIKGIGTDIVSVKRIENIVKYPLAKKILNEEELKNISEKQINDPLFLAFVFASKEAIVKAIGTGFVGISLKDITVYFENECPYAKVKRELTGNDYNYYLNFEYKILEGSYSLIIICKCIAVESGYNEADIKNMFNEKMLFCLIDSYTVDIDYIDNKLLSEAEIELKLESKAANIAAKTALLTHLDLQKEYGLFSEISVVRDEKGKPAFIISNHKLLDKLDKYNIFLSLAHEKGLAVAFLILETKRGVQCEWRV